jgi:hypothetical protein
MPRMRRTLSLLALTLLPSTALAVTSSQSVPSNMGGNGHNISFDGRLFIVRDYFGWQAQLLRPEAVTYRSDGLPDAQGPMLSPRVLILGPETVVENALAICEPAATPFSCDFDGNPSAGGAYDCYDLWIIDSDAVTPPEMGGAVLRRRHLTVWVSAPRSGSAQIDHWQWGGIETLSTQLRGIEPTVTADGRLMVWQGHPANDGQIDVLMYAVNSTPCGASGWSTPHTITHMPFDPAITGTYRLGDRTLRAADGTPFDDDQIFRGAYPWLMPNGDAVIFDAATMPCRGVEDPPGCGPRRNATSVIGYPTNWGVAHVDGGVNPDTNQTVRLFFSSPGSATFSELPVGNGLDVWPFFGSNTSNYVELTFDDGLDGNYGGFWHFNESIDVDSVMDTGRTPDVSGYFNTGILRGGMGYSLVNDGVVGKALAFDGVDDWIEVPNAASLSPVNGITIDFWIRGANPDCDATNNWRLLLGKGHIGAGAYSVVYEEGGSLQARVNVAGTQQSIWTPPVPFDTWTHVSCEYDGPTGKMGCWFNDGEVATADVTPGTIAQTADPLWIGGPGGARPACPVDGDGAFAGMLDEVSISRVARRIGSPPPPPPDAGVDPMDPDAATTNPGTPDAAVGGGGNTDSSGGCGCRAAGEGDRTGASAAMLALIFAVFTLCRRWFR